MFEITRKSLFLWESSLTLLFILYHSSFKLLFPISTLQICFELYSIKLFSIPKLDEYAGLKIKKKKSEEKKNLIIFLIIIVF